MVKKFLNPISISVAAGLTACIGLVYLVSKASSPGIIGTSLLILLGILFGAFVGLSSIVVIMILGFKKFFKDMGSCAYCNQEMPEHAIFCPYCGNKFIRVKVLKL